MNLKARSVSYVVLGVLALSSCVSNTAQAVSDSRELAVIDEAAPLPRISDDVVVWAWDADIYAYDIAIDQEITVTEDATEQRTPDIDNNVVVWDEQSNDGDFDILARNLTTGESFKVATTPADEVLPSISGDWAVWVHRSEDFDRLMARNITTMAAPVTVRETPGSSFRIDVRPEIDAGQVAWAEITGEPGSPPTWTLYAQAIGEDTAVEIGGGLYQLEPRSPSYDIGGGKVVFSESGGLFAYDLTTSMSEMLIERGSPGIYYPTTDGRYVFFEDQRPMATLGRTDLGGYDLSNGSQFVGQYDAGNNTFPNLGDGMVVWQESATPYSTVWFSEITWLLPTTPWPDPGRTDPDWTYYPETGHILGWGFRDYWTHNGGLMVFGYPMTHEFTERNADTGTDHVVQYLERQRFEWHPENTGTPYEVLLGRLGDELLSLQGRSWVNFPKANPTAPHYMPATGHAIDPTFWTYWSTHGLEFGDPGFSFRESLALFGYPLSEPMMETNSDGDTVLTQYFERAVFEYHPEKSPEYQVLLRRLGAEMLDAREW